MSKQRFLGGLLGANPVRAGSFTDAGDTLPATVDVTTAFTETTNLYDATNALRSILFNDDGTKAYLVYTDVGSEPRDNEVWEIPLSTAYDFTTAGTGSNINWSYTDDNSMNWFWSHDGTRVYIMRQATQQTFNFYYHECSTAYDLTTAGSQSTDGMAEPTGANGYFGSWGPPIFNADGTKCFWYNQNGVSGHDEHMYEWDLSTAYDLTTSTYVTKYDLSSVLDNAYWVVAADSTGTKFIAPGSGTSNSKTFTTTNPYDFSSVTAVRTNDPKTYITSVAGSWVPEIATFFYSTDEVFHAGTEYWVNKLEYDLTPGSVITTDRTTSNVGILSLDEAGPEANGSRDITQLNWGGISGRSAFIGTTNPSLDLNFDGQASSYTRATTAEDAAKANGDQLATDIVTQNKGGTVQSKYMGPNGKLINGYVENLIAYSEDFSNAAWVKSAATVSAQSSWTTGPDGVANSAAKIVEGTGTVRPIVGDQGISVSGGVSYTLTYFAKAGERSWVRTGSGGSPFGGGDYLTDRSVYFDLANGVVGTVGSVFDSADIQPVGNGWYRCVCSGTATANTSFNFDISIANGDLVGEYTGNGTSGIYIWGAQLEAASTPSSYIPTSGASVAAQVPRVEYDASGNALGLLVEESRTNMLTKSSDMTHSDWSAYGSLGVTGGQADPAGGTDAVTLNDSSASALGQLVQVTATGTAGATYTGSIYVKKTASAASELLLRIKGAGEPQNNCKVDTLNGVVSGNSTAKIEAVNSDWWRVSVSATLSGNVTITMSIFPAHADAYGGSYNVGSIGSHIVYGPQIEQGEAATSYIPTSGAAATRAADDITLATSSFGFNAAEASVFCDFTLDHDTSAYTRVWEFGIPGDYYERQLLYVDRSTTTLKSLLRGTTGGFYSQIDLDTSVSYPLSGKSAVAYNTAGTIGRGALDGSITTTSPSATGSGTASPTTLRFGSEVRTTLSMMVGHIRRFTYWPRAISDDQLAEYSYDPDFGGRMEYRGILSLNEVTQSRR